METKLIAIRHLLPHSNFSCFVIPAIFSGNECAELWNEARRESFPKASANYPTYYRNNERQVVDDEDLAAQLFEKVAPYLPARIEVHGAIPTENGTWQLQELNSRLRFCKYAAGQYFHRHLDGVRHRDENTQSKLTFMIYLNAFLRYRDQLLRDDDGE